MEAVRAVDGRAEVVEVDEPRGDGVLVHVRSVGICGSDLHLLSILSGVPVTLGHEFAVVTDDGRAVAVEPLVPCRRCAPCEAVHHNRCAGPPPLGRIGVAGDGGMSPRARVPPAAVGPRHPATRSCTATSPLPARNSWRPMEWPAVPRTSGVSA